MERDRLKGKRFLALVRCSTMAQAGSSTDDQEDFILSFGNTRLMVHSGTLRLDGQSGLDWANIDEVIAAIIERKKTLNDFDVVVIQDSSRLTRSGGEHGHYLRFMLRKHGIRVINAGNHIEDPRLETMVRTMEFEIAHGQVRAQSFAIARGLRSSLENRRRTYCSVPPYGIDKLILSQDGVPLYRIRNKPDGSQVKVRPDSEEEYEPLPPTKRGEPPRKHRKAKHERAALVPGDPAQQEVVARIYRRRYQDDWGTPAIARELNELSIPSPLAWRGSGEWLASTVQNILDNPIYTGLAVAFRYASGSIFRVGENGPEEVQADEAGSAERNGRQVIGRPEEVWVRVHEEQLLDYLPADLRDQATAHHRQVLLRDAGGWVPKPRHDPNRDSDFFLKGLLRTSDGLPMSGTQAGNGSGIRHYRVHPRDARRAGRDRPSVRIPATEVELKVLALVQETLLSDPRLEDRVAEAIRTAQDQVQAGEKTAAALEAERRSILDEILFFSRQRARLGDAVVEEAIADLRPKLEAIKARLEILSRTPRLTESQIKERAAEIMADLRSRVSVFEDASPGQVRTVLEAMIADLRIDLATCDLTLTLRPPDEIASGMGPDGSALYRMLNWTHEQRGSLAFRFEWPDGPCEKCRRRRRAA